MTPLSFTLSGALGIQAGLGLDTLTMDLRTIPDDAVTVALRGDNGMGKSTILNLGMSPWREPPQLPGTVYDHFGPTGLRELIWSHGKNEYRSRIEYRNTGKTKTQKAYLHIWDDEGIGAWIPLALPDNTVSDGKSSTYDACLEHILGDRGLYYTAAFRSQGAPKLAEHDDPKALMRALLRLDEPADLSVRAKLVARELKRALDTARIRTQQLDEHPGRIAALTEAVASIVAGHAARHEVKIAALDRAALAKAELERAMAGDIDRQRLIEQRREAAQRLREATDRAGAAARAAREKIDQLHADRTAAQARAEDARSVLAERDAIREAEGLAVAIAAEMQAKDATLADTATRVAALRDLAGQVKTLEAQQAHVMAEGKAAAARRVEADARIADLNTRAGFVNRVPCRGEGHYSTCPALADAIQAPDRAADVAATLPAIDAELAAKRDAWRTLDAQIKALCEQTAELPELEAAQAAAAQVLVDLRARLDAVRQVAARASALELAERNLTEAETAASDLSARIDAATAEAARIAAEHEAEAAAAKAALDRCPMTGGSDAVDKARADLAAAEHAVDEANGSIAKADADRAQHQAQIAALQAELAAGAERIAEAKRLADEIADWDLLAKGLRGIIDLSIEDAGPGIAALANSLLAESYGSRFALRIRTQREQANGVVAETFDITVLDSESGLEASALHKSGGESVWIDKALSDAVALYHRDLAGIDYETLFADEADDGLSADRKADFYRMDRAAIELGGYKRRYFVSHTPAAWESADHVIDLSKYRA